MLEIVPSWASPPATWFTLQFTDWFVVPLTVAVYWAVVPIVSVAGPVMTIAMLGVVGPVPVPVPVGAPTVFDFVAQPAKAIEIPNSDAVNKVRLIMKVIAPIP